MTIRIKPCKPVISPEIRPSRRVRRLMMNQTDYPVRSEAVMNLFVLALLSATFSLTGITLGVVLRLTGF
ncbi:MAG: hypothetical protein D5R99_00325 [Methanocalculus sp. MSAO_Arc1]|uniref:hypothetical protein n=1 Tax=Methanocalculus TaxID=71151 RepID=UPI000FEF03C4|nr:MULTISPECIES: hypothetical protein [unclassified Methanocalculus]MCP1661578.1 hypothetical protein [Methanocalculus sp. AMF5]RQD82042.1 MAG: hypothetical protein D5R99_00325 [Methanocalculus sp. MSAO_Arc1]